MSPTSGSRGQGAGRFFKQVAPRIALAGAIIVLAGCGQDPSGPATASGVAPIEGTADVKPPSGITVRLFANDAASAAAAVAFIVSGDKRTDFTLAADGGAKGIPSSINIHPLPAGNYILTLQAPAGFEVFQSVCGASDGSSIFVANVDLTYFTLAKRGWGYCDFTIGPLP
jgi:hypothetical protein